MSALDPLRPRSDSVDELSQQHNNIGGSGSAGGSNSRVSQFFKKAFNSMASHVRSESSMPKSRSPSSSSKNRSFIEFFSKLFSSSKTEKSTGIFEGAGDNSDGLVITNSNKLKSDDSEKN